MTSVAVRTESQKDAWTRVTPYGNDLIMRKSGLREFSNDVQKTTEYRGRHTDSPGWLYDRTLTVEVVQYKTQQEYDVPKRKVNNNE